MKRKHWLAAGAGLALSGIALAGVTPGGKLYITAKGTKMMESASPTANVVQLLNAGQEVTWNGSEPSNKQWHKVSVSGKNGLVFQSNLAPKPPKLEMTVAGKGEPVDAQAFASSGAATKALGDGAVAYGKKLGAEDSVKQILALEALAKQVKAEQVQEHAKKVGIVYAAPPVAQEGTK